MCLLKRILGWKSSVTKVAACSKVSWAGVANPIKTQISYFCGGRLFVFTDRLTNRQNYTRKKHGLGFEKIHKIGQDTKILRSAKTFCLVSCIKRYPFFFFKVFMNSKHKIFAQIFVNKTKANRN